MADNVNITAGDGTDIVAADDIGGAKYQRVKLNLGLDGVASDINKGQQTMTESVPVVIASDQPALPIKDDGGSITVDWLASAVIRLLRQYSNDTTTVPSASRASGNSSDLSVALYNQITCFLDVTVAPGTSLDVYVKSKDPISGKYVTIGQFAQVTSIGTWILAIGGSILGSDIRFEWIVSGTNATFSIGITLKG